MGEGDQSMLVDIQSPLKTGFHRVPVATCDRDLLGLEFTYNGDVGFMPVRSTLDIELSRKVSKRHLPSSAFGPSWSRASLEPS